MDGGPAKQLTFDKDSASYPTWSPDGRLIAVEVNRDDDSQVAVIPSAGGTPVLLTSNHGQDFLYAWSSDGDKILFAGRRDGIWNVYWVSRSTRIEKQLTHYTSANMYVR